MTEYEYRRKIIESALDLEENEAAPTVELPDDAVGISLSTFSDDLWVRYLVPVDEDETDVDLEALPDGGRPRATTIVGDPQHPAESRPVEISECEPGDRVVIEPEPADGTDAPERIVGEVTRAEEHTTEMAGDARERVTGETLEVNADDGETYVRKSTGTLFVIQEHRTRAGAQDFHHAIAFDSSLRLAGGEDS